MNIFRSPRRTFTNEGRITGRALIVPAAVVALILAAFPVPAVAETNGGSSVSESSMGRVTLTVRNAEFDGDTARIPVNFSFEKFNDPEWTQISIDVTRISARQVGSRVVLGTTSGPSWATGSSKTGTGLTYLPVDGSAFVPGVPVLIYGTVEFRNYNTTENIRKGVAFAPVLSILVIQEQSSLSDVAVDGSRIMGRASVKSSVGDTGAGGFVSVRYRTKASKAWTSVTEFVECHYDSCAYPNLRGEFILDAKRPIPKGAVVEVSLLECGWCTDARARVRAR